MPVAIPGSGGGRRREKPEASGVESAAHGEGRKKKRGREKEPETDCEQVYAGPARWSR